MLDSLILWNDIAIMKKIIIAIPIIVVALAVMIPPIDGANDNSIPSWVKNLAKFWVNDQISDEQFGSSLEYLIEKQIIQIPIIESLKQENANLKKENISLKESYTGQNEKPIIKLVPESKTPIQKIISVSADKSAYHIGESIRITGDVGELLSSREVLVMIKDSNQNDVYLETVLLDENQKFSLEILDSSQYIDKIGQYSITAQYPESNRTMKIYIDFISS